MARATTLLGCVASIAAPQRVLAQPPVNRWRGTVELTIGGESAASTADLSRVSGLAVDSGGRVFVADGDDARILVFSAAGAAIAEFGRKGSGPLEFKGLSTIAFGPDRRLWVRDEGNARMLTFDVSRFPVTTSISTTLGEYTGGSRLPITFERSGERVDEKTWFDERTETFRPLRILVSRAGVLKRVDTLPIPPGAFTGVHHVTNVQRDASRQVIGMKSRTYYQPFGPTWIRAYGPDGLRAEVVGSAYSVRIMDASARVVRTIARAVTPVPLSATERKRADSLVQRMPPDIPFGVPKAKAPVIGLHWSADRQLWVERAVPDSQPREADVFDPDGRHVATAEWPRAINLMDNLSVIRGQSAYALSFDASDLPSVVRLRFR